jgi:hypothetical protein
VWGVPLCTLLLAQRQGSAPWRVQCSSTELHWTGDVHHCRAPGRKQIPMLALHASACTLRRSGGAMMVTLQMSDRAWDGVKRCGYGAVTPSQLQRLEYGTEYVRVDSHKLQEE